MPPLPQHGKHGALAAICGAKLLAIAALLLLGPERHLTGGDGQEQDGGKVATAEHDDRQPGQSLKEVVWAGDEVEAVAPGDLALGASVGRAQVAQRHMRRVVGRLGKQPQRQGSIAHQRVGLGVPGSRPPARGWRRRRVQKVG